MRSERLRTSSRSSPANCNKLASVLAYFGLLRRRFGKGNLETHLDLLCAAIVPVAAVLAQQCLSVMPA